MKLRHASLLALAAMALISARAADLRLGMIGMDTSHVVAYLNSLNDPASKDYVPGGKIVAGFKGGSMDVESSRTRVDGFVKTAQEKFGVKMYDTIEELAKNVDAILILSVDGRPHLDQFRRTLASKKPVFIDKPLAGSLKDALEIQRLSRESKVPVFSSSSLRYAPDSPVKQLDKVGDVASAFSFGPAELEPHHPDMFWYGIHATEALYTVMGAGCEQVVRTHTKNTDVITGVWSGGRVGTMQGNRNGKAGYGVTVIGSKGVAKGGEKHSYKPLVEEYMKFFQTGIAPVPLETTIEILAFMEAADESKRRGGAPVKIADVMKKAGAK
ncbi:Gfo/Idh/MocA family protein [Horticoccus sp. 23ND18S-11]|uniref:Gfo/Idh/MocA family protein n=1 Tax=Horticoccus sp. 23ND18S-11 TaxID=3391832 RepID=UPI0039C9ED74